MEIHRTLPRHPRSGPGCLAVIGLLFLSFGIGFGFANRAQVALLILPAPTATPTQSPANWATRAKLLERDGDYEKAVESWRTALQLAPNEPRYYAPFIRLLVRTKQTEEAIEVAERGVELAPDNDEIWTAQAEALLTQAERWLKAGEPLGLIYSEAYEAGRMATTLNPNNAVAYAYMAYALAEDDFNANLTRAQDFIFLAEERDPENPIVLYYSADLLIRQGYYDTAQLKLEQITNPEDPQKKSDFIPAYITLATIYRFYRNEVTRAFTTIDEALDIDPNNAELYDLKAYFYGVAGEYKLMEESALQAIELDPQLVRAHARLGHAYFKNQNYPKAIEELELATSRYEEPIPETSLYFAMLGLAYYYENPSRCNEAVPLFELALQYASEDSPAEISALEGLGFCRRNQLEG